MRHTCQHHLGCTYTLKLTSSPFPFLPLPFLPLPFFSFLSFLPFLPFLPFFFLVPLSGRTTGSCRHHKKYGDIMTHELSLSQIPFFTKLSLYNSCPVCVSIPVHSLVHPSGDKHNAKKSNAIKKYDIPKLAVKRSHYIYNVVSQCGSTCT